MMVLDEISWMQPCRVPILDSAAPMPIVVEDVEPYYMFDPDHLHDRGRAAWVVEDKPRGTVGTDRRGVKRLDGWQAITMSGYFCFVDRTVSGVAIQGIGSLSGSMTVLSRRQLKVNPGNWHGGKSPWWRLTYIHRELRHQNTDRTPGIPGQRGRRCDGLPIAAAANLPLRS